MRRIFFLRCYFDRREMNFYQRMCDDKKSDVIWISMNIFIEQQSEGKRRKCWRVHWDDDRENERNVDDSLRPPFFLFAEWENEEGEREECLFRLSVDSMWPRIGKKETRESEEEVILAVRFCSLTWRTSNLQWVELFLI